MVLVYRPELGRAGSGVLALGDQAILVGVEPLQLLCRAGRWRRAPRGATGVHVARCSRIWSSCGRPGSASAAG